MTKLYLADPYARVFETVVVDVTDGWVELADTAFYPGGGGQPPDRGMLDDRSVDEVREDGGRVWHRISGLAVGQRVRGAIDWDHRYALMRHHGLMHVVNTVARDELGGVITGVQLGAERSRIDFRLAAFAREQLGVFEASVNAVLARDLAIEASFVDEAEYQRRPELIRTLNVAPPVVDGRVRIVEIAGFDTQACGATHVHRTSEIGRAAIVKFDNKGRDNKRFYWELGS